MIEKFQGLIFYIKKIKDNDLYIKVLSNKDKVVTGIVYGGNSSKKKLIYQNGYFIDYFLSQKNQNSPLIFSADITQPLIGKIINDKFKTYSLLSILSLINLSILEGQVIKGLFESVKNLINCIVMKKHWIVFYCEWLFNLLQIIGYQIDYKNNSQYLYFDMITQDFVKKNNFNTIEFPHTLFQNQSSLIFNDLNSAFTIFESIFSKNHLDGMNYKMPESFINFKKIVLTQLKEKNNG